MIFNLVCILRIVACVDAASRMFQPQLQAPVLSSLRSNATTAHQKRWLGVQTGPDNHNIKLWPNGEVKYSISSENEEDQKVLPNLIQQATELWHGSGLPANFKFTEVEQLWCISNRGDCLMVVPNTNRHQESTLGRPPSGLGLRTTPPKMDIDPAGYADGWQPGTVMAHEMGHVWGLHHEHQNPIFWAKAFNPNGNYDGSIFTAANFHCTDIPDYSSAMQDALLDGATAQQRAELCTDIRMAEKYQFSAAQWLPLVNGYVLPGDGEDRSIDWESIMLYSSHLQGVAVLTKPDGTAITAPEAPSPRDVQGLVSLYGGSQNTVSTNLLNEPSNPQQAAFLRLACSE